MHTHMRVYLSLSASAYHVKALHARPFSLLSPWGAVSPPVGLGFPCVTMITFTSTIESRRTQITVTPPHPQPSLDPGEI